MTITPIKPSNITLLTTVRCTAACDNCCFGCTPKQGRTMTLEEMKAYVDKCLEAYPDTISSFDLTGGECMLLGKDVDRIFAYAKSKGLKCQMVSNAFWATDYDKAYKILKRLKRNGLKSASFSTGDDHNKYVPWQNVRNASVAAARLGIESELRMETLYSHAGIYAALNDDPEIIELTKANKLKFSPGTWMEYNNKGKKSRNMKVSFRDSGLRNPCKSLFQTILISPYGEVYACCGIGVCHIPQMRLGNINKEPIKTIYERAFDDFLKIWLFTDGPEAILKYVHEKTGQKFSWHSHHNCDHCRTIFKDKNIIPFIREHYYDIIEMPLLSYKHTADATNEARTKR